MLINNVFSYEKSRIIRSFILFDKRLLSIPSRSKFVEPLKNHFMIKSLMIRHCNRRCASTVTDQIDQVIKKENNPKDLPIEINSEDFSSLKSKNRTGGYSNNSKFVYVLNIPKETNWKQLKEFMNEAGPVTFCEIKESTDGKKFGKVRYDSPMTANAAQEILNKQTFFGNVVSVVRKIDNEKVAKNRAFVYNLNYTASTDEVYQHLSLFADVRSVTFLYDHQGFHIRGCAIAEFTSEEESVKAITNSRATVFQGRLFLIREDRECN